MHLTIAEHIVLAEQEVSEEPYEKYISCGYAFMEVIVIGPHKSIPEVP